MTVYHTNLFPIKNLETLELCARIYDIEGLPPVELEKNLNQIRTKIRNEYHIPAAILFSRTKPRIAVPSSAPEIEGDYSVIPQVAYLRNSGNSIDIHFGKITDETEPIADEFLDWSIRGSFWGKTWQDGRRHFPLKPSIIGEVSRYQGFSLGIQFMHEFGIHYISIDPVHRYIDTVNLLERLNAGFPEEDLIGVGKNYLYHFGRKRYPIQILNMSGFPAGETRFTLEDKSIHDVYSYTVNECQKTGTSVTFTSDDPGIVYRYPGKTNQNMGISSLCYRTMKTDEPIVSEIHNKSILSPKNRYETTLKMRDIYIPQFKIEDIVLEIAETPLNIPITHLRIPDHRFGNNRIFTVNGSGPNSIALEDLPRIRNRILVDPEIGVLSSRPLERQFFLAPESMSEWTRKLFCKEFEEQLERMLRYDVELRPILFKTEGIKNNRTQVKAIFDALEDSDVHSGHVLLVLPKGRGDVHDYVKQNGWPEIVFKCVTQEKIESFYTTTTSIGDARTVLRNETRGKFFSFVNNCVLGYMIINQQWPWALSNSLRYDIHIGMDVLNDMAGFSFIHDNAGKCYFDASPVGTHEKISFEMTKQSIMKGLEDQVSSLGSVPNSILLHRDGLAFVSEIMGFESAIEELVSNGTLPDSIETGVIEIRKSFAMSPRIFEITDSGQIHNPQVGAYFKISSSQGVVCNTGWPFRIQGTAKPIHVVIRQGEFDINEVLQDVFSLANLSWSAPWSSMSVPITIKLCDEFLRPIATEIDE